MQISATAAYPAALYPPAALPRPRFTIRADGGFLATCDGVGKPPVAVVPNPLDAVHFVDFDAAYNRAHLMTEVGWTNLRVVEVLIPSRLSSHS